MISGSQDSQADPSNSNWMISFGDLLTLLVCFFLAIMSERWRKELLGPDSNINSQQNQTINDDARRTNSGITLAEQGYGTLLSELALFETDVVLDVSEPNSTGLVRLKEWVSSLPTSDGHVTIEACSPESKHAWEQGERLALGIKRMLESFGEGRTARIRSVGKECTALESWTPATKQVKAVLKLIGIEKQDG